MNYEFHQSSFSKAMLTGVFVGFVVTVICLIYNVMFRTSTGFSPADFINVSSLIFVLNLIFWGIGIVYALLLRNSKRADGIFEILFILLMGFCIWKCATMHRWDDIQLNNQFKILLGGILAICTIGIVLIPYLYHHRKFIEHVI